jgi:hypothetical protein
MGRDEEQNWKEGRNPDEQWPRPQGESETARAESRLGGGAKVFGHHDFDRPELPWRYSGWTSTVAPTPMDSNS